MGGRGGGPLFGDKTEVVILPSGHQGISLDACRSVTQGGPGGGTEPSKGQGRGGKGTLTPRR